MFKNIKNQRIGRRLEDGKTAHTADHQQWSRRQFLSNTSMMAAGGMLFGSSPLLSWASPLIASLYDNPDNDRVLILVRLSGGNDGLNTIVPFSNSDAIAGSGYAGRLANYQTLRPTLKLTGGNVKALTDIHNVQDFALPKLIKNGIEETGLFDMWNAGNMSVIHSVGYPNQNRSHFSASDLWANGAVNDTSAQDQRQYSGWMGRYFKETLPAFLTTPPTIPPAIQIGSSSNLIFRGVNGSPYDMVFSDLEAFDSVIQNGALYGNADFSEDCIAEMERVFVRQVADSTFRYAKSVKNAYEQSTTPDGLYEGQNGLADQLKIVSRLIKGKLGTKIYMVTMGGFDTHAAQDTSSNPNSNHKELLRKLSSAIQSTFTDLTNTGDNERVMMMTFSEFGRTVRENGGKGTDHGTLAPVMLFGGSALQGKKHYGTGICLDENKVDAYHSVQFEDQPGAIDFRTIYDKVLRDWLCADAQVTDNVLNHEVANNGGVNPYQPCSTACADPLGGMISGACNATVSQSSSLDAYIASLIVLGYNVKADDDDKVEIKYATKMTGNVTLEILEENGVPMPFRGQWNGRRA